jgi:NitT/TauT family transport system permease protein
VSVDTDTLLEEPATARSGGAGATRAAASRLRPAAMAVLAVLLVVVVWELYKLVGPEDGGEYFGMRLLPRSDDVSMPHVWSILERFGQPEVAVAGGHSVLVAVLQAMMFSLGVAGIGWAIGVVVGMGLAILMQRFRTAESGLLPYVVLSQTVPLVALAPLVVGWGGQLRFFGRPWEPWMSVAMISAYLAFFPVAVGGLRGLQSPAATQVEMMRAYAGSWWQTMVRLRLPASVPYLMPSLRLAAAASIIGAIVAEISTGTKGGIGRLIIDYAQAATGDPPKPYTAILGAAVLGLIAAGLVGFIELALRRYRPVEARG